MSVKENPDRKKNKNKNKFRHFLSSTTKIYSWTSKRISKEIIKNLSIQDNSFAQNWIDDYTLPKVKFDENCLRQNSVFFLYKYIVNLYITYELDTSLIGTMMLTKNADLDKYEYSGDCIGFDTRSQVSWSEGTWCKNIVIFGVDDSSSLHADNKKNIS